MVELTNEERLLLKEIMGNKFSNGAYSGMIFNACIANKNLSTEEVIKKALEVRLTLDKLAKDLPQESSRVYRNEIDLI